MEAVRVLVVEDEFLIGSDLIAALESTGYEVVGHAFNFEQAEELLKSKQIDIVLVDITLDGDRDGIELADHINQYYQLPFIYLTSHSDTATVQRAKSTHPSSYLVKPFDANDIFAAIEIALANYAKSNPVKGAGAPDHDDELLINNALFIKRDGLFLKLKLDDILYMQSDRGYIELYTATKSHTIRSSFGDLLVEINARQFFRVHRSYVVNMDHVDAINSNKLLIGETEIPVGRSYRELLLKRLKTAS